MASDILTYVWPYPGEIHQIQITAVRTANDDGTEPATITAEEIATYIEKANNAYASTGIHFVFDPCHDMVPGSAPQDVLKSTVLNRDHGSDIALKTKTMLARNSFADGYPDSLVIFFRGGSDKIKWHYSGWVSRVVVMNGDKDVDYALAHEVGHYLHLEHTFGSENPQDRAAVTKIITDRLKAGIPPEQVLEKFDGDLFLVTDTPPDPRGTVFVKEYGSKCLGTLEIVEDAHTFVLAPDRSNLMSYYFDECGPQKLSQQQSLRVREAIEQGNRRRLASLQASKGPIRIEQAADALSRTKVDQIAPVLIDGRRIAIAARSDQGTLVLSSWQIGLGGTDLSIMGRARAGRISEVVAVHAGLGYVATVVRESHNKLKVIVWHVAPDGAITRIGDQLGDTMSQLAACRFDRGYFATAGRDAQGNLTVSVWNIDALGSLQLCATARAGAVSRVSIVYANPVWNPQDKRAGFIFATPVRDGSGMLRTILWRFEEESITRLETAVNGPTSRQIAVSSPDLAQLFTASQAPNRKLVLQSWRLGEYDGTIVPASQLITQAVDRIATAVLGPDLVATATRGVGRGGGNLDLTIWKTTGPELKIEAAAQASAGEVGSLSLCRVAPDLFVTAMSDKQKQLKVIAWRVDYAPIDQVCVPVYSDNLEMPPDFGLPAKNMTVGDVVRDDFVPLLQQISGIQISPKSMLDDPDRTIVVALADDPILLQAPAAVQKLLGELKASQRKAGHLFHCDSTGAIWIVAKERRALRAALYRYLHRLGCRWLACHDAWTIIPKKKNLRVAASQVFEPRVDYVLNSGLSGFTFQDPPLPDGRLQQYALGKWAIRLGMPNEIEPGAGHLGSTINKIYQCEFRANPKLLAWHNGERGKGPDGKSFPSQCFDGDNNSKPCYTNHGSGEGEYPDPPVGDAWDGIQMPTKGCTTGGDECDPTEYPVVTGSNPELDEHPGVYSGFGGTVKIWSEYVRAELARRLQQAGGEYHPNRHYVHADVADGGGDCVGDKCINLLREGPYGQYLTPDQKEKDSSPSDRYFHLSNEVARFIEHWYGPGYGISTISYGERAAIPAIPIRHNILVGVVIESRPSNRTEKEFFEEWGEKRNQNANLGWGKFSLGVTKQWVNPSFVYDAPKISPATVFTESKHALDNGVVSFIIQSTNSSLSIGIHLLGLMEQIWGAEDHNYQRHLCEWFTLAFGPAAPPIRRMFERWWDYFEWTQHEIGASCRDMLEAQQLADAAGVSAEIQTRIDHVKGYVWYLYLHEHALDLRADYWKDSEKYEEEFKLAMHALMQHIWSVYPTFVLNSFRLRKNYFRNWIIGGSVPDETGIPIAEPGSPAEDWLFDKNAQGWQTVHPLTTQELQGFMQEGAQKYPEFPKRRKFSDDLVPLQSATSTSNPDENEIKTTTFLLGEKFVLYKDAGEIAISMWTFGTAAGRLPIHVHITGDPSPVEVPVNHYVPTITKIPISGPAGLYHIEVINRDAAIQWRWLVPSHVPFVMVEPRNGTGGWDVETPLYFFVPKNETKIVMSYNTRKDIQFCNPAGEKVDTDPRGLYQWECKVCIDPQDPPKSEDGKVWSFTGAFDTDNAVRLSFENCPRLIAWSAEQMLVPKEVL